MGDCKCTRNACDRKRLRAFRCDFGLPRIGRYFDELLKGTLDRFVLPCTAKYYQYNIKSGAIGHTVRAKRQSIASKISPVGQCCFIWVCFSCAQHLPIHLAHVQPLVRHDPPAPPPYYIVGGLVFVPLSEPFLLHQYGSKFDKDAPIQMRWYWSEGVCKFDGHEIIVLSQVLASPLTVGFTDFYDAVLLRFNGTEPENLGHLIQMVRQCKASYLEFEIEGHCRIVLPRRKTFDQTPAILRDNMIPRDRSIQYT